MSAPAGCRQNFSAECEAAINKQVSVRLHAAYAFTAMARHFERADVALPGFHRFFLRSSGAERQRADQLMAYQSQRGGRLVLLDVGRPSGSGAWASGLEAMRQALELALTVNAALLQLQAIASRNGDPHLQDFVEGTFLSEQVESIKQLSDYVSKLSHCGPDLGEFMFDKAVLQRLF